MPVQINGREVFNNSQINSGDINNPDIDGGTADNTTIGGATPAAGAFTTLKMTTGAAEGVVVSDGSGNLVADTTPTLGTPSSGTLDNCTTATATDNDADTTLASTAFAKSEDAVLAREPDQGVALTAATSGSSGITVADNDNIDFGTGNFTLVWRGSQPNWQGNYPSLMYKSNGTGFQWYLGGGKQILADSATSTQRLATVANTFVANTVHELVASVVNGTTVTFYEDGVQVGTAVASASFNTSNALSLFIQGTATARHAGTVHHAITYNRALTAAEVLDLYRNGVNQADKWGSQTAVYSNSSWTGATGATPPTGWDVGAAGIFTIFDSGDGAPYDTCLKIEHNGAVNNPAIYHSTGFATTIGKKYRFNFFFKNVTATNGTLILGSTPGGSDYVNQQTLTDVAWTKYSTEFTAVFATAQITITVLTSTSGQYALFDEVTLTEIGATIALQPEGIATDKWYDSSSNGLNATYPATGSSLTRPSNHNGIALNPATTGFTVVGGTTSKTLTVTAATSLDEAVAMSSKAPKASPSFTVGIGIGGVAAGTGGVAFPATAVAVADANTLDDYEEGTWTPTLNSFTIVGATPAATGRYTKIGDLVYFEVHIAGGAGGNTTIASVGGTSSISGLPYTPINASPCLAGNLDGIGYGVGVNHYNQNIYPPTWAAYGGGVDVNGTFRI